MNGTPRSPPAPTRVAKALQYLRKAGLRPGRLCTLRLVALRQQAVPGGLAAAGQVRPDLRKAQ